MIARRFLLAAVVFVVTGCAGATPYATDAEKATALHPWTDCVRTAIARLDDEKSDPVSIAYGIEPGCSVTYEKFGRTFLKGVRTPDGLAYGRARLNEMEL